MSIAHNKLHESLSTNHKNNWYKVDFHVHSPASYDYQLGIDTDEAYLELLQNSKDNQIDIICITDHNNIRGYFQLQAIENEVRKIKEGLQKRSIQVPNSIEKQLELFDNVMYLPGVELDIYPNIHLIIVFDPNSTEETLSDFLTRAGYPPSVRDDETASRHAKWTVLEAIEEAAKLEAITIAAHIDSNKGLYEETKTWGQARIDAFTHPSLWAMEFIRIQSRDQINNLIRSEPHYRRKTKLAFIQSSDFHKRPGQNIGDRRTFIRIEDLSFNDKKKTFECLKIAFRNPDEYISAPESPEVSTILKNLENAPYIESINTDEELQLLYRYICAFGNTEDGTIVIGRNNKGNWTGIEVENTDVFLGKIITLIHENVVPNNVCGVTLYQYSSNRYICTIRIGKSSSIQTVTSDDKVYILENGHPVPLTTKKIIEMAEVNLAQRYNYLSITERVYSISRKLSGLQDTIDILSIIKKFEDKTIQFNKVYKPPLFGGVITDNLMNNIKFPANGYPDGNFILLREGFLPRFETHYLRISAPIALFDENAYQIEDKYKFSGPKIIITEGGGVFFDDHDDILIFGSRWEPAIFIEQQDEYKLDNLYVVAYLKSAISIWYSGRCLGSIDLRSINTMKNHLIPKNSSTEIGQEIILKANELLDLERKYLTKESNINEKIFAAKQQNDVDDIEKWKKALQEGVKRHNNQANNIVAEIDTLFFLEFGLSDTEVDIINKELDINKLAKFTGVVKID